VGPFLFGSSCQGFESCSTKCEAFWTPEGRGSEAAGQSPRECQTKKGPHRGPFFYFLQPLGRTQREPLRVTAQLTVCRGDELAFVVRRYIAAVSDLLHEPILASAEVFRNAVGHHQVYLAGCLAICTHRNLRQATHRIAVRPHRIRFVTLRCLILVAIFLRIVAPVRYTPIAYNSPLRPKTSTGSKPELLQIRYALSPLPDSS